MMMARKKVCRTRPKLAYGWQGLDWIVGPEYSFRVFLLLWLKNVTVLTWDPN